MDEERLKNGGTILTEKYFEEQLEKIWEIWLSERKFYQKITEEDWVKRLDIFLMADDREILTNAGTITAL